LYLGLVIKIHFLLRPLFVDTEGGPISGTLLYLKKEIHVQVCD